MKWAPGGGEKISRYNSRDLLATESGEVDWDGINEIAEGTRVGRVEFEISASCG